MKRKSGQHSRPGSAKGQEHPSFLQNPAVFIVLGLSLILMMTLMLFTGSAGEREAAKAREQGQRAVRQITEPVLGFRRLLSDDQVHELAQVALADALPTDDLQSYLEGRMREVTEVRLFPPDVHLLDFQNLGENGFIILDMLMAAQEKGDAPVQAIELDGQSFIASAVRLGSEEEQAGYLMVFAGVEILTSNFDITLPQADFIVLEQVNGRYKTTTLKQFGDPAMATMGLERIRVPGSLFRIAFPLGGAPSQFSGMQRLMVFVLGALLLAYGMIKRQLTLRPVLELTEDPAQLAQAGEPTERGVEAMSPTRKAAPEPKPAVPEAPAEAPEEPAPEPEVSLSDLHFDPELSRRAHRHEGVEPVQLSPGIFRAYDIRGIVDQTLDAGVARQIGQAIGSQAVDQGAGPVVVGRDGRHSGPELVEGLVEGMSSTGCDVINIGAVPTGVLYFVAHECGSGSGVMVTGSHNPPDYNGFKVMIGGETLSGDKITALYRRLVSGDLRSGRGTVTEQEAIGRYRERIASDIQLARPIKVVADCGNGIGGICAADVLRDIGAEVLPLFDEVDGSFPNHHPDPSEPANLADLIESVKLMRADLGVAFDGDADRLGVVTPSGEIIFADRTMMLFVREILGRNPGARIIYDVKCTGHLDKVIRDAGGEPEMYKTGHSLIKNRMKEVGAPFAGEMSGHFFFKDRWYGFDCGIYSAARLLEILAQDDRNPEEVLASLPNSISTPELKVHMQEGENHAFIAEFQEKARFTDARVSTIDGVRADFVDGWGLCRASNTTPVMVVRFDAETEEALEVIQEAFRMQMLAIRPDLELPF